MDSFDPPVPGPTWGALSTGSLVPGSHWAAAADTPNSFSAWSFCRLLLIIGTTAAAMMPSATTAVSTTKIRFLRRSLAFCARRISSSFARRSLASDLFVLLATVVSLVVSVAGRASLRTSRGRVVTTVQTRVRAGTDSCLAARAAGGLACHARIVAPRQWRSGVPNRSAGHNLAGQPHARWSGHRPAGHQPGERRRDRHSLGTGGRVGDRIAFRAARGGGRA